MLSRFISIRRRLDVATSTLDVIVGQLRPSRSELQDILALVDDECADQMVLKDGKASLIVDIEPMQLIELRLFPLQISDGDYYESEEDFLARNSQSLPARPYYIHTLDYDSTNSTDTLFIAGYRSVVNFITFLKSIATYSNDHGVYWELFYFQSKELLLLTEYDVDDARKFQDSAWLIKEVTTSVDFEARKAIIINEVTIVLSKIDDQHSRFKKLLALFSDVVALYKKSFQLYVEKYSFDKIRSEVDKEVIESKKRIHSVLNDAQTKLVAIPAASLIVIGQFDLTGEKLFANIVITISALIFGCLLEVLIRHQISTLDYINSDVLRFKAKFEDTKLKFIEADFNAMFNELSTAYNKQKDYLFFIRCLIWFPLASTLALLSYTLFFIS